MKRMVTTFIFITLVLSMASLTANATSVITYDGNISPSTLGGTVTTDLPMFNGTLGTLTDVQITLNFTIIPYAQITNTSPINEPQTFSTIDYIRFGYNANVAIQGVTHGTDSWDLATPAIETTIYGSNQMLNKGDILTLVSGTSMDVSLTTFGLDLAGYTGAGILAFGTSGGFSKASLHTGARYLEVYDSGGNLMGTASVIYKYEVPEPATICMLGLGVLGLLKKRRA